MESQAAPACLDLWKQMSLKGDREHQAALAVHSGRNLKHYHLLFF